LQGALSAKKAKTASVKRGGFFAPPECRSILFLYFPTFDRTVMSGERCCLMRREPKTTS
jgi:hypothetical protein